MNLLKSWMTAVLVTTFVGAKAQSSGNPSTDSTTINVTECFEKLNDSRKANTIAIIWSRERARLGDVPVDQYAGKDAEGGPTYSERIKTLGEGLGLKTKFGKDALEIVDPGIGTFQITYVNNYNTCEFLPITKPITKKEEPVKQIQPKR